MPKPAGAVIRSYRQQRGIKVREFAVRVGIARKTAYAIETGQTASIEVLHRMARELAVPVDELIENSAVAS
jgi:transcriptional regulator with XRE-family HTH domain